MSERTRLIQAYLDSLTAPRPVTQIQADGTTTAYTTALAHEPATAPTAEADEEEADADADA